MLTNTTPRLLLALLAVAASQRAAAPAVDHRLDVSVGISASGVTVAAAARELGDAAGVPLAVADADVARRPFQLFVRRQALEAVMREMAETLATPPGTCLWEKAPVDGRQGFRLLEDARSRHERLALLRRLREERRRRLETDLKTALHLANLDPNQLAALRDQWPELAYWMPALRGSLGLLGSLSPAQRDRVLTGQGLNMPFGDLSPAQQGLVSRTVGRRHMRLTTPGPGGGAPIVQDWESPRDLPSTVLTFRLTGSPDRPGIRVFLSTLPGGGAGWPDALHPMELAEKEQPDWMKAALQPRKEDREKKTGEREAEAEKDPDLRVRVTVKAMQEVPDTGHPGKKRRRYRELSACLEDIADQTGLSVLGDYDPCWDDFYSWQDYGRPGSRTQILLQTDLNKMPLWQALDSLEDRFGVSWEKRGKFVRIRSPRVLYAELDGIDMLEHRLAPPPHNPELEEARRREEERKRQAAPPSDTPADSPK